MSAELRTAERLIDHLYERNPLARLPFSVSAWNVLGVAEDAGISADLHNEASGDADALFDNMKYYLRTALNWLWPNYSPEGIIPHRYEGELYGYAADLLELARNYHVFVAAYTYASHDVITMELNGTAIRTSYGFDRETTYEAYERIASHKRSAKQAECVSEQRDSIVEVRQMIARSLHINGEHFRFTVNPKLVGLAMGALAGHVGMDSTIPGHWDFGEFTLDDFRHVYDGISALGFLQLLARRLAADRGCPGLGFANGLRIEKQTALISRIARYSGVKTETVARVVEWLTFGEFGMEFPDPALQPLIPLTKEVIAIPPILWTTSARERNFFALLNRVSATRKEYARLVEGKEQLMRDRMRQVIGGRYRYENGKVPGRRDLPDVDLAIISAKEGVCFILELKWILTPGDVREVIEKDKEIGRGVIQLLAIKADMENCRSVWDFLRIDNSCKVYYAVLTNGFVGTSRIQDQSIDVLDGDHFCEKMNEADDAVQVGVWIESKSYLPKEDVDFRTEEIEARMGEYTLQWRSIVPCWVRST